MNKLVRKSASTNNNKVFEEILSEAALLNSLINETTQHIETPMSSNSFRAKKKFITRTYSLMLEHYDKQLRQNDLARYLHITPRTLRRRLQGMKTSFTAVQHNVRKQVSKKLLIYTDYPITEIGLMIGFYDTPAFTKAFKSWFGISPSRYRKFSHLFVGPK